MDEDIGMLPTLQLPDMSAAAFINALRKVSIDWHAQLPEDAQIEVWVCVIGGGQLKLGHIMEFGFNCVYIQGEDEHGETYILIAHQATLQLYCRVKKITPDHPRRVIGFGPRPHLPEV